MNITGQFNRDWPPKPTGMRKPTLRTPVKAYKNTVILHSIDVCNQGTEEYAIMYVFICIYFVVVMSVVTFALTCI